jgi:hypothetical protein
MTRVWHKISFQNLLLFFASITQPYLDWIVRIIAQLKRVMKRQNDIKKN